MFDVTFDLLLSKAWESGLRRRLWAGTGDVPVNEDSYGGTEVAIRQEIT